MTNTAVLLLSAPMSRARTGAMAAISLFLIPLNASDLDCDDHPDSGRDLFWSGLAWDLDGFNIPIPATRARPGPDRAGAIQADTGIGIRRPIPVAHSQNPPFFSARLRRSETLSSSLRTRREVDRGEVDRGDQPLRDSHPG
jgi:hypothetical protein